MLYFSLSHEQTHFHFYLGYRGIDFLPEFLYSQQRVLSDVWRPEFHLGVVIFVLVLRDQ